MYCAGVQCFKYAESNVHVHTTAQIFNDLDIDRGGTISKDELFQLKAFQVRMLVQNLQAHAFACVYLLSLARSLSDTQTHKFTFTLLSIAYQ